MENTMTRRTHCKACGNPDCVNVSDDPYWPRCPAVRIETVSKRADELLVGDRIGDWTVAAVASFPGNRVEVQYRDGRGMTAPVLLSAWEVFTVEVSK